MTAPDQGTAVRRRVVIAGRVQAVGFRASCAHRARAAGLAGWVTNLPDGRVVLEAEGVPKEVDAFIAAVQERMLASFDPEQRRRLYADLAACADALS